MRRLPSLGALALLLAFNPSTLPAAADPAPAGSKQATDSQADARVATMADVIASRLDPRVAVALAKVDGPGRRLLALRSYLRSRAHLVERWSWTEDQIKAFETSPANAELQAAIEHVKQAFALANPGYELWVNPQVRSLDIQIEHWNDNESVAEASAALLASCAQLIDSPSLQSASPAKLEQAVTGFLEAYVPVPTPTIAAPGLSPHGQMRAIDFQVQQGSTLVAGTRTATIASVWDAGGWTAKLEEAVRTAGNRFAGPLASPREPWHYTYTADAVAAR